MTAIDFHGKYGIQFTGNPEHWESITSQYPEFATDDVEKPNLRIHPQNRDISTDSGYSLGDPSNKYMKNGGKFIIKDHGDKIAIDPSWEDINCTANPPDLLRLIIEVEMRKCLSKKGIFMVHASAIEYNDQIYIFPAWRHTGKTNLMLSLLESGGNYLSDDRILLSSDGDVYSFPTAIHLLAYNYNTFPDLVNLSEIDKMRVKASIYIDKITSSRGDSISKALSLFANRVLGPSHTKRAQELYPNTEVVEQSTSNHVYLLQTLEGTESPQIEEIDTGAVVNRQT